MLFVAEVGPTVTLYALVYVGSLIGTLICFVCFTFFVSLAVVLRHKGTYQGLVYLLIYTGAVAVLFVLVLLLADSRQAGLAIATLYLLPSGPTWLFPLLILVFIARRFESALIYLWRRHQRGPFS